VRRLFDDGVRAGKSTSEVLRSYDHPFTNDGAHVSGEGRIAKVVERGGRLISG
jgi:hypothetical protein